MPNTVEMMSSSQGFANLTGLHCKADGWYGHRDGLHTVSIQVVNFTGRIHIEGSLALNPSSTDWFPISLGTTPYIEFPLNPNKPTGSMETGGDTLVVGRTFKVNALWVRARMDRTYLEDVLFENDPSLIAQYGNVVKIILAR
jgi:hypothetical protein